jgi:hypothetical protein
VAGWLRAQAAGRAQGGVTFLVLALVVIEGGEIVEALSGVGMQGTQLLLVNGQGTQVQRLGLLSLALIEIG